MRSSSSRALPRAKHYITKKVLNDLKSTQSIAGTKQIHAHIFTSGLSSSRLSSNLSRSYALAGHVRYARKLFDELPDKSSALISSVMRMYVQKSLPHEALRVFSDMVNDGESKPDDYTFPFSLKACAELGHPGASVGAAVHCRALTAGCDADMFVRNSMLSMYMNFGDMKAAWKAFDEMPDRGVVSWNTMIHGYFRNGMADESVRLFLRMTVEPDSATAVAALPACGLTGNLAAGRKIHALIDDKNLAKKNVKVYNALIDMYARCGDAREARAVFERIPESERDVVAWTSMINGHIMNGEETAAIELCGAMLRSGVKPNTVTMSLLLSACGSPELLQPGRRLHCLALRLRLSGDVYVETALVDMYAKCDSMTSSLRVFECARSRPKVLPVWSAVIAGCSRNGMAGEAVWLFRRMLRESVGPPTDATLGGLVQSYGALADSTQASNLHSYLAKTGIISTVEVATGLIDAYSKSGNPESARKVFEEIREARRDVFAWSTMIACLGRHGEGPAAVRAFDRMVESGVRPTEVTLTSALHACSHSGMVDDGVRLFSDAVAGGGLRLSQGHYTCVVDMLGRAHRLREAHEIAQSVEGPSHAVWGALLGACATHADMAIGESAAQHLFELEPGNTGNYVLMAAIYAKVGRWDDAERMHRIMDDIGLRKSPAHSLLQVRNSVAN